MLTNISYWLTNNPCVPYSTSTGMLYVKNTLHTKIASLISLFIIPGVLNAVSASYLIIDDRSSGTYRSNLGSEWQLVTDQVMGGISDGELTLDDYQNRNCLRMRGDVSTENNGGFVQIALTLSEKGDFDATDYTGVEIDVAGNNQAYNVHLRTSGLWFPWQSYRFTFEASTDWKTLRFPFTEIAPYKTNKRFQQNRLVRIGLVGIGRDFEADLCVASVKLYRE